MGQYEVISYGLDYLRFRMFSERDVQYIRELYPYLDIHFPYFHGHRFADFSGEQLAVMRMFEDLDVEARKLAVLYPVKRIDVYIDVVGNVLSDCAKPGTTIMNHGRLETIYSAHLKRRGNLATFGRAYDAQAAGHYESSTTRFEVEYKSSKAEGLLGPKGWAFNPIGVALRDIKALFGVSIWIPDIDHIEYDAPQTRYEHDRQRFYARYGRNILLDLEQMGHAKLYEFIMESLTERDKSNENETS